MTGIFNKKLIKDILRGENLKSLLKIENKFYLLIFTLAFGIFVLSNSIMTGDIITLIPYYIIILISLLISYFLRATVVSLYSNFVLKLKTKINDFFKIMIVSAVPLFLGIIFMTIVGLILPNEIFLLFLLWIISSIWSLVIYTKYVAQYTKLSILKVILFYYLLYPIILMVLFILLFVLYFGLIMGLGYY